jgi:Ca2+-binding RTX toxin-like protein
MRSANSRHNPYADLMNIAPHDLANGLANNLARGPSPVPVPPAQPQAVFTGTSGNDQFAGTSGDDTFNMDQGGNDKVTGKDGLDEFYFGNTFDALDSVNGGAGTFDRLFLGGNAYAAGFTVTGAMVKEVEQIHLAAGDNYTIATTNSLVAAGQIVFFSGYSIDAAHKFHFDGSAETDGRFQIAGGFGNDTLIGGAQNDLLYSAAFTDSGGKDNISGNGGNDFITFGQDYTQADKVAGGGGAFDTLVLNGDYSGGIEVGKAVSGIETLHLGDGFDYMVKIKDQMVANGDVLAVSCGATTAANEVEFDGSAETNGSFSFGGGAGNDVFTGSPNDDLIEGQGGKDTLAGEGGNDTFRYIDLGDSMGTGFDTIVKFDADDDAFLIAGGISGVDDTVNSGALSEATFDADLAAAIGDGEMAVDHAVIFKPDSGDFDGAMFVIMDVNNVAGYQAGADFVVMLDNPSHMANFGLDYFVF